MHARGNEPPALHIRAPCKPGTDDLAVEVGDENELTGLFTLPELLHRPRRLVRNDGALDADPALEVGVALGAANLDHPARSACPRSGPVEGVRGNREVPPATRIV
jgi:hypothetical protein